MTRRLVHEDDTVRVYEVTDADGDVIGEDREAKPTAEEVNARTLDDRAGQALDGLRAYIAAPNPTAAQTTAAVKLLCRVAIALTRLRLGRLDGVD